MTRDMDLGRKILLELEGEKYDGNSRIYELPVIDDYSDGEVEYHVGLLQDAGLLKAELPFDGPLIPQRLTWQGHEFLDAARDDSVWKNAKSFVQEKAGILTFEAIKAVLPQIILGRLNL